VVERSDPTGQRVQNVRILKGCQPRHTALPTKLACIPPGCVGSLRPNRWCRSFLAQPPANGFQAFGLREMVMPQPRGHNMPTNAVGMPSGRHAWQDGLHGVLMLFRFFYFSITPILHHSTAPSPASWMASSRVLSHADSVMVGGVAGSQRECQSPPRVWSSAVQGWTRACVRSVRSSLSFM